MQGASRHELGKAAKTAGYPKDQKFIQIGGEDERERERGVRGLACCFVVDTMGMWRQRGVMCGPLVRDMLLSWFGSRFFGMFVRVHTPHHFRHSRPLTYPFQPKQDYLQTMVDRSVVARMEAQYTSEMTKLKDLTKRSNNLTFPLQQCMSQNAQNAMVKKVRRILVYMLVGCCDYRWSSVLVSGSCDRFSFLVVFFSH